MKKSKRVYLTIEQKRNIVLSGQDMPTAIFSAGKREYVVKPRGTIFGFRKRKKKSRLLT